MTVAYIISAYKLPSLLVRLVRRLDGPRASFYIHVDARTPEETYRRMAQPLDDLPNVHFLPRHACHWGDFGHVQATLKGLEAAVESERRHDYVVLLTGQDYPLASNDEITSRLEDADGQVFMRHFALPSEHWSDGGIDRIEHRQLRVGGHLVRFPGQPFGSPWLAHVWLGAARSLGLLRRFPEGLTPYGGSSYWCMPADCARYVLDFVSANSHVVEFFRQTAVPDEMMFQTIVMNSPFRSRVVQDNLRYIDWSGDGDSPEVLTSNRLDELMASGKLFARKFDPTVDSAVLDRIDAAIDDAALATGAPRS